jgi:hypothetical protein
MIVDGEVLHGDRGNIQYDLTVFDMLLGDINTL